MAANLGDSPTTRALRGNFSCQRSLPHLAKHWSLGFSSSCGPKSLIPTKIFPAWYQLLVTLLMFAFTWLRYRIKVCENSYYLRLLATCDGRAESDAGISEKPNWFRCTGSHQNRKGRSLSSTSRIDFLFVKFDRQMMESWTSAAAAVSELLPLYTTHVTYAS